MAEIEDQQQLSSAFGVGFGEWTSVRYRGQGFTPTLDNLTAISLHVTGTGSRGVKVYIDTADGDSIPENGIGGELYSFVIPNASLVADMQKYDLPTPLALTPSDHYVFYLAPWDEGGDAYADDYRDWRMQNSNAYAGGNSVVNVNGTWGVSDGGNLEFKFITWGEESSGPEEQLQTVEASARILRTETATVTANSAILKTSSTTVTAKANINILQTATVEAKARIAATSTQTVSAKARIGSEGGMDIEVPINFLDLGVRSNTTDTVYDRTSFKLDTDDYDGALTVYLEILAENDDGSNRDVHLVDSTSAELVTITVPTSATDSRGTRIRSSAFSLNSGADTYRIKLDATTGTGDIEVFEARLIIQQVGATKTRVQIPLIQKIYVDASSATTDITNTTSNTYTQTAFSTYFNLWQKNESRYSTIGTWSLEAVMKAGNSSDTASAILHNVTDDAAVTDSAVSTTGTTIAVVETDFTNSATGFDNLDTFELRVKTDTGTGASMNIYRAALYLAITDVSKLEAYYRIMKGDSGVINAMNDLVTSRVLLDTSKWSATSLEFFHEATAYNTESGSSLGMAVQDDGTDDSGNISGGSGISGSDTGGFGDSKELRRSDAFSVTTGNRFVQTTSATGDGTLTIANGVLVVSARNITTETETITAKANIISSRYWVGGTATWDGTAGSKWAYTSGGTGGAPVPTSADNVFFDASSSGNCTLSSSSVARSINCTGFTGTITHPAATTIAIGGSGAGAGNVALKLVSGMTYTKGHIATSAFSFVSTYGSVAQTIDSGGKSLGNITFNGVSGSWKLGAALTTDPTATMTLTNGSFDTDGLTCSWGLFSSVNSNVRSLTLGASAITMTGSGTSWTASTSTNMTLNAGTSVITFHPTASASPAINTGGLTYYGIVVTKSAGGFNLAGGGTVHNFTQDNTVIGGGNRQMQLSANLAVTGTFTYIGNTSDTARGFMHNNTTRGVARTLSLGATGSVNFVNVDFRDIAVTGTAAPVSGTFLVDLGGNSGIIFATPVTRYWVGNGGNTSDSAKWSATSGGSGGASVPTAQDTAIFDANSVSSGSQTISVNLMRMGTVDLSAVTNNPNFNYVNPNGAGNSFYGDLIYGSDMTVTCTGAAGGGTTINMEGRGTHIITSAGKTHPSNVSFFIRSAGGSYELQDDLVVGGSFGVSGATFDANDHDVTIRALSSNENTTRHIYLGNGTWEITGADAVAWNFGGTGSNIYAEGSTIKFSDASSTTKIFRAAGKTYNDVWFTGAGTGGLTIEGTNTLNNLIIDTPPKTVTFPNVTTTMADLLANGTVGNLITLQRTGASGTFTVAKTGGGIVACDYLSISNSTATPSDTWYAGANSTNGGGNTGWIFTAYTGTNTITAKASILATATQTIQAKANISATKETTVTANSTIRKTTTRTVIASARILTTETPTVQAVARILDTQTQTVEAGAAIQRTATATVQAKAAILKTVTATTSAVARVIRTETATVSAKARILVPESATVEAKANILATITRTVTANAIILGESSKSVNAKAAILRTASSTVEAKARILRGESADIEAKARILVIETATIAAGAAIQSTTTRTASALAAILRTSSSSITAVARIKRTQNLKDLVVNGDFETGSGSRTSSGWIGDQSYGWYGSLVGGSGVSAEYDTTESYSGSQSMKIVLNGGGYAEIKNLVTGYHSIPKYLIKPNTAYRLTGYFKAENVTGDSNTGGIITVLTAIEAGGSGAGEYSTTAIKTDTGGWVKRERLFTTSGTAYWAHVECRVYGHNGAATLAGSFWYDNIILEEWIADAQAYARVKRVEDSTIEAGARILTNPTATVSAKANIYATTARSITAKANILATQSTSASAKARIARTASTTVSAYANIQATLGTTVSAKALLLVEGDISIQAKANIKATNSQEVSASARIIRTESSSISAKAAIKKTMSSSITAGAAILVTQTRTITANAAILVTGDADISAKAAILKTFSTNTFAKATIKKTATTTVSAVAAIEREFTQTVSAKARILVGSIQSNVYAQANILATKNRSVSAKSRIRINPTATVSASALITVLSTATVSAKAAIKRDATATVSGQARILTSTVTTVTAVATVRIMSSASISAKARILAGSTQATISAKAAIKREAIATVSAKAAIRGQSTATISAVARIAGEAGIATISAKANIATFGVIEIVDRSLYTTVNNVNIIQTQVQIVVPEKTKPVAIAFNVTQVRAAAVNPVRIADYTYVPNKRATYIQAKALIKAPE